MDTSSLNANFLYTRKIYEMVYSKLTYQNQTKPVRENEDEI